MGPKTVACVLLFACRKPVLPVDTHVHRVSRRLGLIGPRTDAEKAHGELARLVPPRQVLEFHIQLIRHGRSTCSARAPKCEDCPLLDLCPEGLKTAAIYVGRALRDRQPASRSAAATLAVGYAVYAGANLRHARIVLGRADVGSRHERDAHSLDQPGAL